MDINTKLYKKLLQLQWLLQKQHMKTHANIGPMADTSRGQGRILALLRMRDGISTKDLSYLLGIRVSSLNELLAKLEKNEYITRTPSESDKRVILIYLTEKGQTEEKPKKDLSNVFDCLSEEEQDIFSEYIDRIITTLKKELDLDDEWSKMFDWMENARSRMGEEGFEELMSLREKMHGMRPMPKEHFRRGFPQFAHGMFNDQNIENWDHEFKCDNHKKDKENSLDENDSNK